MGIHQATIIELDGDLPSAERLHSCGKSPCSMGKSTISISNVNSYVSLPEGNGTSTGN